MNYFFKTLYNYKIIKNKLYKLYKLQIRLYLYELFFKTLYNKK